MSNGLTATFMARALVLVPGIVALSHASPADADELFAKIGGWEISRSEESCSVGMEFEGPGATTLFLVKFVDGTLGVSVTNSLWSAKEDELYKISYRLNGKVYSGGKTKGVGTTYEPNGFITLFEPSFEEDFARGSTLRIFLENAEIDRLALTGTAKSITKLNQCLNTVQARIAARKREEARWSHLPEDPFKKADPLPEPLPRNQPASPIGNPANWVSVADYPTRALREERQGAVSFKLVINADGRVSSCNIILSSGSPDLDETTCSSVSRRARFTPATNSLGRTAVGEYVGRVNWSIPRT